MPQAPADDLAEAFYFLAEMEFFRPYERASGARASVLALTRRARGLEDQEFADFARALVRALSAYCRCASRNQEVLYRAFDGLEEVLGIDYRETRPMMPTNSGDERLYEGGGTGVQTSYSTILKVLEHLRLPEGAHMIDLGSGFGSVGLATGLWRDDLRFTGYEFVGHRVNACNATTKRAGVSDRVLFLQQDLSASSFQMPAADAYYLYDPFSASTYDKVLAQLAEIAREREVTVITKAGARGNFLRWAAAGAWSPPESVDEGAVLVFRSR